MVKYLNMKKPILRTICCLLVLTLLLCGLSACTSWDNFYNAFINKKPKEEKVIRIAVFEPLTGEDSGAAKDEIAGIELARKLFPSVLDSTIELVYFDNKSDPETAKELAEEISKDETIKMVLGSYGNTVTVAAGDIFEEAGLPAIAITCTNPLITSTNTNYVRTSPVDSFEALGAAEFIFNNLEINNACAFYQAGSDISRTRAETFVSAFSKYDGAQTPSLYAISVSEGAGYDVLFEEIEASGATAVYFPADPELAKVLIEEAGTLGFSFKWIGSSLWAKSGIDGIYYTIDYDPYETLSSMTPTFLKAYREAYGRDSTPSYATALGFDAYLLALAAIREAESAEDRTAILSALYAINGLSGATGTITMSPSGDPIKSILIEEITGSVEAPIASVLPGENNKGATQ